MHNTRNYCIHKIFCCGILAFVMIVCSFFALADQHDSVSSDQHDSVSSDQHDSVSSDQHDSVSSDQHDIVFGLRVIFYTQIFLGILLLAILTFLLRIFFQFKQIPDELDNVKYKIDSSIQGNHDLKVDLLNVNKHVHTLTKEFEPEILYNKLAAENKENTQKIFNSIESIIDSLSNGSLTIPIEATEASEENRIRSDKEMPSQSILEFRDSYNAGIKDRQAWGHFLDIYRENCKIDVVNAEERYRNPQADINPIFKNNSAGFYLVCYIEAVRLYAVVPVYGLVVEPSTYTAGALGEVFKCSNFDNHRNYQIMELIVPAIFEPDDKKETWTLKDEGILELQET